MNKEEIQARVNQIQWFHNYELLPGIMTNGLKPIAEEELEVICRIPEDLRGKRVLDIGCADGYYTFLAESRGASVVAIDAWPHQGFLLARELRGSQAEFRQIDVYDLRPDVFGLFDLVFFMGLYYHLKHPLLALERIASVTRELAIIESQISTLELFDDDNNGVSRFYQHDELADDPTNWWVPNLPCLAQTACAAGFPRAEIIGTYNNHNRGVVHAHKGPRTAAKILDEDFVCGIHSPIAHAEVSGVVTVSGLAFSKLNPETGTERVTLYLDRLDDPLAELGQAEYGLRRENVIPRFGPRYSASGFEFTWNTAEAMPGPHTLYALVEGQRGWHYARIPIVIKGGAVRKFFNPGLPQKRPALNAITLAQPNASQASPSVAAPASGNPSPLAQNKLVDLRGLGERTHVALSTRSSWLLADKVRRACHNLVIYYVNQHATQQNRFNQAIITLLKQTTLAQEKTGADVAALQLEVAALRAEVQTLQAKSDQLLS
ncbi:MAG: DUF1698 domain-containing protein [Chloroflexi bacterium]|nr:DUF1698 domain-containing protein [Chloroflexota bacterium]